MEFRTGNLVFTSKIDSGNLARVERIVKDEDEETIPNYYNGAEPKPDYEFNVWTNPDCVGTDFENGNRSWFHFGVRGYTPGRLIKINIVNMNRQGKLYNQGYSIISKTVPGRTKWERIRDRPTFESLDGQFTLSFTHRFFEVKGSTTYFAFCYPWSYTECQNRLEEIEKKFESISKAPTSSPHDIYYHRELLCYSLDKLRIDLITISSHHNICKEEEPRFDNLLFPDKDTPRCKQFRKKRVFLLSSRVHPGETPSSHVFNGFLDFILRENDARARQLRKQYIFKLIPMLNPDGVMRGHYRTDQKGVNLNRVYLDPNFELHPSIYASKSILVYHHVNNSAKTAVNSREGTIIQNKLEPSQEKNEQNNVIYAMKYSSPGPVGANQSLLFEPTSFSQTNDAWAKEKQNTMSPKDDTKYISECAKFSRDVNHSVAITQSPKYKVEPLNLSELDPGNTSMSDCDVPLDGPHSTHHLSSSCSSVLSRDDDKTLTRPEVDSELRLRLSELRLSTDMRGTCISSIDVDSDIDDSHTEHIGNEGSDDDNDFTPSDITITNSPHLCDPKLKDISPDDSGVAFYVDLHGHASKRGCFIYGNFFDSEDVQVQNMLFPKLISMNTAHFDFPACNFSEKNMYTKDKRDGMSKEGSGRVAVYKATGIIHSYTLECNYNTGRMVNPVPPAFGDDGRATPPPLAGFPPKYTPAHYEEVGKAVAIAALDITDSNPWSRITLSEYSSIYGVREAVRRYIRSLRGGPRIPRVPLTRSFGKQNNYAANAQNARGRMGFDSNITRQTSRQNQQESSSAPHQRTSNFQRGLSQESNGSNNNNASRFGGSRQTNANVPARRHSQGTVIKKELAPVREGSRNVSNQQRKRPMTLPACPSTVKVPNTNSDLKANLPLSFSMSRVTTETKHITVPRQLSADATVRLVEEEKIEQLRNVHANMNHAGKPGPPSKIPLPIKNSFVPLSPTGSDLSNVKHPRSGSLKNKTNAHNRKFSAESVKSSIPDELMAQIQTPSLKHLLSNQNEQNSSSESPKRRRKPSYTRRKNSTGSPNMKGGSGNGHKTSVSGDGQAEPKSVRRKHKRSKKQLNLSPTSQSAGKEDTPPVPAISPTQNHIDISPLQDENGILHPTVVW